MLARFKRRYFYWEAVVTGRKLLISILNTFLKPMLVVVFGILIIIISLLAHMFAVPFRYKFHNLMEYIVLLSILLVLFFGLLFFVDKFPTRGAQDFCIYLAFVIIIGSTVVVVVMIVWDFFTRRKKDQKLVKQRRKQLIEQFGELKEQELQKEYERLFPSTFSTRSMIVEQDEEDWADDAEWNVTNNELIVGMNWTIKLNPLVEDSNISLEDDYEAMIGLDKVVQFNPPFYNSDSEMSDEGDKQTLNDITEELFGITRIQRKMFSVRKKVVKVVHNSFK